MIARVASSVLLAALWLYRSAVSPYLTRSCRFIPSCSRYAQDAVRRRGPWVGGVLAVRRLLRCHPLSPGGFDRLS